MKSPRRPETKKGLISSSSNKLVDTSPAVTFLPRRGAGGDWLPLKAFFYLALQAPFLLPLAQKTLGVRHRQAHSGRLDNVAVFLNLAPGCPSALRNVWRDWSKMWVSQSPGFTWSQPTPPALQVENRGPKGEPRVTVAWLSLDTDASENILEKNLN